MQKDGRTETYVCSVTKKRFMLYTPASIDVDFWLNAIVLEIDIKHGHMNNFLILILLPSVFNLYFILVADLHQDPLASLHTQSICSTL